MRFSVQDAAIPKPAFSLCKSHLDLFLMTEILIFVSPGIMF